MTTQAKRLPVKIALYPHPAAKGSYVAKPTVPMGMVFDRENASKLADGFHCQILNYGRNGYLLMLGQGLAQRYQPCKTFSEAVSTAEHWAATRYFTLDRDASVCEDDSQPIDMWSLGG